MPLRVLILGGSGEASDLARLLAGDKRIDPVLSYAGRTRQPSRQPIPTRSGGFGGIDGLVRHLREHAIEAMVDATHPFAGQMSTHAVVACVEANVPLASLVRPPWQAVDGDRWQNVPDMKAAAEALGSTPKRVFLAIGRQELHVFTSQPQHDYLARTIDPPDPAGLPPKLRLIPAHGEQDATAQAQLLGQEKIEIVVSKNAGGAWTHGKIAAARQLGLPVIMVARPHKPTSGQMASAEQTVAWLHDVASRRGV